MTLDGQLLIDPLSFFSGQPAPPKRVRVASPEKTEKKMSLVPLTRLVPNHTSRLPHAVEESSVSSKPPQPPLSSAPPVKSSKIASLPAVSIATPSSTPSLWVEKYKPKSVSDLVGNGPMISKLVTWLKNWKAGLQGNERSALLSGSPGIGKTSTARLAATLAGYTVLEFNASDTRGKKAVEELASGLATNTVLFGGNSDKCLGSKVAIIMDEVDGMSAGDRGGNAALIQMIKLSKLPVICICNDRQDAKIRSLANHCLDLRFLKPSREEVAARAALVAKAEALAVSQSELLDLAEASGCDIRQVINNLQLMNSSGHTKKSPASSSQSKDLAMSPFDVVKGLFTSAVARTWSYQKRNELFFTDYDMIPLLVQQNYVKCVEKVTDVRALFALRKSAEYISVGDILSRAIHTDAHWNLLPEMGVMCAVGPTFACNNVLGYPEFPSWLGKQSTQNKNARLMRELRTMGATVSTVTSRNLKLAGYSDVLYELLVSRLRAGGPEAIKSTIDFIDQIGVSKDSLFEVLSDSRFSWQQDPYSAIDSKTKSALTRTYNGKPHLLRSGAAIGPPPKKSTQPSSLKRTSEEDDQEEQIDEDPGDADARELPSSLIKVASRKKK